MSDRLLIGSPSPKKRKWKLAWRIHNKKTIRETRFKHSLAADHKAKFLNADLKGFAHLVHAQARSNPKVILSLSLSLFFRGTSRSFTSFERLRGLHPLLKIFRADDDDDTYVPKRFVSCCKEAQERTGRVSPPLLVDEKGDSSRSFLDVWRSSFAAKLLFWRRPEEVLQQPSGGAEEEEEERKNEFRVPRIARWLGERASEFHDCTPHRGEELCSLLLLLFHSLSSFSLVSFSCTCWRISDASFEAWSLSVSVSLYLSLALFSSLLPESANSGNWQQVLTMIDDFLFEVFLRFFPEELWRSPQLVTKLFKSFEEEAPASKKELHSLEKKWLAHLT